MKLAPVLKNFEEAMERGFCTYEGGKWEFKESFILDPPTPLFLTNTFVDIYPACDIAVFGDHHAFTNVTFQCLDKGRNHPFLYFHGTPYEKGRVGWWQGERLLYFNSNVVAYRGNLNEVMVGKLKPTPYFRDNTSPTQSELEMLSMISPKHYEDVIKIMEYLEEQQ